MIKTGSFTVVEKQNMQKILAEQAFQQTGCTNSECAVRLGRVLNVRRIIVGSFAKFLSNYILSVRVVDVESGKVVAADQAKAANDSNLDKEIERLALRLAAN